MCSCVFQFWFVCREVSLKLSQVNGIKEKRVAASMLLPHEVIHALATCDAGACFQSIFFGALGPADVSRFWEHCKRLDPWKDHEVLQNPHQDLSKLIAIQIHGDGAEFFRDDECFAYSWSSVFGAKGGLISDTFLNRFPLLYIHERHMQQPEAARLCIGIPLCVCCNSVQNMFSPHHPQSYPALVRQVKRQVNKQVSGLVAWSLKHAASGLAPTEGFYGEGFQRNTWRSEMAGKRLSNGFTTFSFKEIGEKALILRMLLVFAFGVSFDSKNRFLAALC